MDSNLPSGTVTFLFTDIEGSTELWEKHPKVMQAALAEHDAVLREAIKSNHGYVIKGRGDGVHAVFETALDAVHATIAAQRALQQTSEVLKTAEVSLRIRMGLHTGEAEMRDGDYYGQALNRAARIMAIGHGGQILLSEITAHVAREHLPADASLLDLGEHDLKGLLYPEHIYQLAAPGLQKDFPALNSISASPNNLPVPLTSFIGRERELAEAREKLASARLLTLIGPGGIGKTRLALQIAADQLARFKGGVWLVELAPLTAPAFVVSALASVFNVREVAGNPLINLVIDYLRAREVLIVLDNCEHLVEASAQIAGQLLHACPNLKILTSSREALGIEGEVVYRVPSLSSPPDFRGPDPSRAPRADFGSLTYHEATRLFIDRATKTEPRFHVTEDNAGYIVQICHRLDGIPLAIELAAARVQLFTPGQIAERLDNRFKLLAGGSRTALPRQQTLRALMDWSYQLLNEIEQRALRRLAVFSGGWTFEAAEAILGESEALEGLVGLVNKSLVNVEEQSGQSRYSFLETIRQYALEKLVESGEAIETRDRHSDYFSNFAQQSHPTLFGTDNLKWLDETEAEYDNLRAALEWAASHRPEKALKLAYGAGGFWNLRDHNSEARAWCNLILEKTESMPDLEADRARLYALVGWSSITIGEHKQGRAATEKAIALAHKVDDLLTLARANSILALACMFLGDYPAAQDAIMNGEKIVREQGLKSELVMILTTRAQMAYYSEGDVVQARAYLDESVKLVQEGDHRWASSLAGFGLARVALVLGDFETARARLSESAEFAMKMGNKRVVYSSRSEFAHALRAHGELDEALEIYRDLLPKWKDIGHRSAVAHELECVAFILITREEPARAATLLGAAEALRQAIDSVMTKVERVEYEKEISALRAGMAEAEFQQGWNLGRSLIMEQAIAYALESDTVKPG